MVILEKIYETWKKEGGSSSIFRFKTFLTSTKGFSVDFFKKKDAFWKMMIEQELF